MAQVDLSKATVSNWKQLTNAAIKDAKSRCGKANIWNGRAELNAIKSYFRSVCSMTDLEPSQDNTKEKLFKNMYRTLFDAVTEANLEIEGTDCW